LIKPINIFISYRRKDSKANARSLYQALKDDFEVFFDIDKENSISYGQNFPERIKDGIEQSDIFIPVIGQEFALELDNRKDKHDWVKEEILLAKKLNKTFLPIFIDDAGMPSDGELAQELEFIREIDTLTLSHDKFEQDIETLKKAIRHLVFPTKQKTYKIKTTNSKIFEKLELYLHEAKWEEASRETVEILLKITKREKYGWLRIYDINELSCDIVCMLNRLWEKYSQGNFSFSSQLELIEANDINIERPIAFIEFSELVSWKTLNEWSYKGNVKLLGSFPLPICLSSKLSINRDSFITFIKKLKECRES